MSIQLNTIYNEDCLETMKRMPDGFVDCVVTSPPYWGLRDYGNAAQVGIEPTYQEFINRLTNIFSEVKRVLKPNGTCWVNLGDTYQSTAPGTYNSTPTNTGNKAARGNFRFDSGLPAKSMIQIPSRFAIAMSDTGWILRNKIIWHKPNALPFSGKDRFTNDFEEIFFFVKSHHYFFNRQVDLNGRNKRAIWSINVSSFKGAHFATYPEELVKMMILPGSPENGVVFDPFMGSGTTAKVAKDLNRTFIGSEISKEYCEIAEERLRH